MKKTIKKILVSICIIVLLVLIDLLSIFNINKPIFAIKEDNGDSVNLVYRGLFYDTYICHEYSIAQIKSKGTKFTCAYIDIIESKESNYKPTNIEKVSINISDISLTGATIVIKDMNKNPYSYGEWYIIEKQINDKWYEVDTIIEDYGFNEIAYIPDKNNKVKFVIDWKWLYGELPLGSYRLLKQVNNQYISIEFEIDYSYYKL